MAQSQTIVGTEISILPREVQTQQSATITITGVNSGASKVYTIINKPKAYPAEVLRWQLIKPETSNTSGNEEYVFTLSSDEFFELYTGDYAVEEEAQENATHIVLFEVCTYNNEPIPDPVDDYRWGGYFSFVDGANTKKPLQNKDGRAEATLSSIVNKYPLIIDERFLTAVAGKQLYVELKEITTQGQLKIATPEGEFVTSLTNIDSKSNFDLIVNGGGVVKLYVQVNDNESKAEKEEDPADGKEVKTIKKKKKKKKTFTKKKKKFNFSKKYF